MLPLATSVLLQLSIFTTHVTITASISKPTHTHTHTHPFNGPLSGTTRVSQYHKGETKLDFTEATQTHTNAICQYPGCHQLKQLSIKSNMTLIMVDKPQPSYNLLNVIK